MEKWQKNLYILWITQVISLTSFGFGLPFMPFYVQELGITNPDTLKIFTGVLSAAPAITMAIMAPVWGYLSDRYGRKLMIQRAMFAAVAIIGLMGMAQNVWQLVFLRLMQGLFTGTVTASSTFVASNTPNNRLSYALGFLSSSTFVGYSIGPLVGGLVAEHYGYRMSFMIGALLMLVGGLILTKFLVEDKSSLHPKREKSIKTVEKRGIQSFDIMTGTILMLLLMLVFHRITRSVFTPFLPLYIKETLNQTEGAASLTGLVTGVVGLLTALSAVVLGRLGDRYEKPKLMQILLLVASLIAIGIQFTSTWIGFVVLYGLLFFVIGGIEPMITSMSAQRVDADKRGTLFGIQGLMGSLGWLVSPAVGTYISIAFGIKEVLWLVLVALVCNFVLATLVARKN